jgi:hypothetical protein
MPPLAATLPELAGRVRDAVARVNLYLHNNVCTETGYRHDICQATHCVVTEYQLNGGHIKLSNQIRLIFFCAFYFMSNITIKSQPFNVDTVYQTLTMKLLPVLCNYKYLQD